LTFSIVGDAGVGDFDGYTLKAICKSMSDANAHFNVHLGDVYYTGDLNEEQEKFLNYWPQGKLGSFSLNSNHEMYSGGQGYFNKLLKDSKFAFQQNCSFFLL